MPDERDPLLDELADALRADADAGAPEEWRLAALRAAVRRRADGASAYGTGATARRPPSMPAPPPPAGSGGRRGRRRWAPALALGAAALLAGGIALGGALGGDEAGGPAGTVEYAGPIERLDGRRAGTLEVREIGTGRTVDLRTGALPLLPRGRYYEVWFVAPDDAPGRPNRISAGTFHPDAAGRSDLQLKAAVDPALYPELEVTAEPGDGNPAATGPPVLHARLVR